MMNQYRTLRQVPHNLFLIRMATPFRTAAGTVDIRWGVGKDTWRFVLRHGWAWHGCPPRPDRSLPEARSGRTGSDSSKFPRRLRRYVRSRFHRADVCDHTHRYQIIGLRAIAPRLNRSRTAPTLSLLKRSAQRHSRLFQRRVRGKIIWMRCARFESRSSPGRRRLVRCCRRVQTEPGAA